MDDKLIEKIKKMMNVTAENGATEGEVYNAAIQVQRLMAKHGITSSDIEQSKNPMAVIEDRVEDCPIKVDYDASLAERIASAFLCKVYFQVRQSYTFKGGIKRTTHAVFLGKADDVLAAREVFIKTYNYMTTMKRRYAKEKAKERRARYGEDYGLLFNGANFGDAPGWAIGFIRGLSDKLAESRRNLEQEYAVALVVDPEVKGAFDAMKFDKKGSVAPQHSKASHLAAQAGYQDGKAFESQIE